MTVRRLGIVTPTLNTDTDLITVTDNYLVSVIATNTNASAPADVRIWVEPSGAATADEYSYIAYDIEINVGNALETHRFAVNSGDTIRVRATTSDVSFTASGIPQTTIIGYGTEPLDYLDFNTSSTATLVEGRVIWDDGEGSPTIGLKGGEVQLNLGQENVALCYNGTGSQLTSGQVVYISGAQGQKPSISLAAATSESTSSKTFGMVTETIENGAEGFVTTFGIVNNVNTLGFTEGSALWLSTTAGQYTQSPPTSPNHLVFVGYCLKANETAGRIFINPQNGYELEELHDILISSLQDGQALVYESASGLWKNASIDALPSQTGNDGKYLTTDGTDASWADISGAVYSADAPSSPTVGQLWIESDVDVSAYSVYQRWSRTLTGSETVFTGLEGTQVLSYPAGLEQVYLNGVLLVRGTDYTATDGTTITLTSAGQSGDVIEILSPNTFASASYYTKSEIDLLLTTIDGGGVSETYSLAIDGGTP